MNVPKDCINAFASGMSDPSFLIGALCMDTDTDQPTILSNEVDFSFKVNALGTMLAREGRHPGVLLVDRYQKSVDIMGHTREFSEDTEVVAFFDAVVEENVRGAVYIPFETDQGDQCVVVMASRREYLNRESVHNISNIAKRHFAGLYIPKLDLTRPALLTERERECLICAACGQTEKETARKLCISESTVRTHLAGARAKLNAKNKSHAVAMAFSLHELTLSDLC